MVASPDDDQRDRRDSDFQARVLAVLERPKKSRVLAVINSAFFLWIMTALFLTIGGSYYTAYHKCLQDAENISGQYPALSKELLERRAFIKEAISSAETVAQLREKFKSIPYLSFDLKERSTHALTVSISRLRRRIDILDPTDSLAQVAKQEGPFTSDEMLNDASDGEIPYGASDDQLPKIKSSTLKRIAHDEERLRQAGRMAYAETCSPHKVVRSIVDPNTKIVETIDMDDQFIFYPY